MRVCFIGSVSYSNPLNATEAKKFNELSKVFERISVIGFSRTILPKHFRAGNVEFFLLPRLPLAPLRYLEFALIVPALAAMVTLKSRAQILIAQSPFEGAAAAISKIILKAFHKVAVIVENHGDFEESLFIQRRVSTPSVYRSMMRASARIAFSGADALRAVSRATEDQLKKWAPSTPVSVFPAWTDIESFLAAGEDRASPRKTILYAGVLIPRKGIHFLIEAFSKVVSEFPDIQLRIIGSPDNVEYERTLIDQVKKLGLSSNVRFETPVSQIELAQAMSGAVALVLPSISEGLGRVVFEAMACRTPVIGSRVGGIPDQIQDGSNGILVPPGDVAALTEALRRVLSDPAGAAAMGDRARDFSIRYFSPHAYSRSYAQLAERALRPS